MLVRKMPEYKGGGSLYVCNFFEDKELDMFFFFYKKNHGPVVTVFPSLRYIFCP